MDKGKVLDFFGGVELTAYALGISGGAVKIWPDPLTDRLATRVIGVGVATKGAAKTRKAFPEFFAN